MRSCEGKQGESGLCDAERAAFRNERLAGLLRHCRDTVPRWKSALGSGEITAANVMEIHRSLPLMRRSDVQADPRDFIAAGATDSVPDATGGSSGTPMQFQVDRATQIARESSLMWADGLAGWQPGERIAMLWGSEKDLGSAVRSLRLRLRWIIDNRRWYNAFDMEPATMRGFHEDMQRFRPHILVAYASALRSFADFLREAKEVPRYPLRAVISSAEVMNDSVRRFVEEIFPAPVFDRYGNREFGAIAAECEAHDGRHVNESDVLLEILSPEPERVPGPIVVTYLHNFAMPFIRYDTGDCGTWLPPARCRCGRTTSRIGRIEGRSSDIIRTSEGKMIHGEYFSHLLYGTNGVRQFQFVQDSPSEYRLLLLVDSARYAGSEDERIRAALVSALGARARIRIEHVEELRPLTSGKRRFTVSKLGGD
ncbi:MAG: Phenylacetate-coenzyme A ligase [Verrucomicrobia bacterium ADurb.Bin345]|nr:MAG: Phenylacetate-coenzyme A ligase [Verrucomicrobia bacterium ADurb.Bin345]